MLRVRRSAEKRIGGACAGRLSKPNCVGGCPPTGTGRSGARPLQKRPPFRGPGAVRYCGSTNDRREGRRLRDLRKALPPPPANPDTSSSGRWLREASVSCAAGAGRGRAPTNYRGGRAHRCACATTRNRGLARWLEAHRHDQFWRCCGSLAARPAPTRRAYFPAEVIGCVERIAAHKAAMPTEFPTSRHPQLQRVGQALWCCDPESDRLPAATVGPGRFARGRGHPRLTRPSHLHPQDVPAATAEVHAFATIILNSSRPTASRSTRQAAAALHRADTLARGGVAAVSATPARRQAWWNTPSCSPARNIANRYAPASCWGCPHGLDHARCGRGHAGDAGGARALHRQGMQCNAISLAVDDQLMGWVAGPLTMTAQRHSYAVGPAGSWGLGRAARASSAGA